MSSLPSINSTSWIVKNESVKLMPKSEIYWDKLNFMLWDVSYTPKYKGCNFGSTELSLNNSLVYWPSSEEWELPWKLLSPCWVENFMVSTIECPVWDVRSNPIASPDLLFLCLLLERRLRFPRKDDSLGACSAGILVDADRELLAKENPRLFFSF